MLRLSRPTVPSAPCPLAAGRGVSSRDTDTDTDTDTAVAPGVAG